VGAGPGNSVITEIEGGVVGIIIDARGSPSWANLPKNDTERRRKLLEWFTALKAYPIDYLERIRP